MIEQGRYKKLSINERVCPFCPNQLEDETHFLLVCKTYSVLRLSFLQSVVSFLPSIITASLLDQTRLLLDPPKAIAFIVGKYISSLLDLRKSMLSS
jgi:hypothetical protein